jgi:hypothetical protein
LCWLYRGIGPEALAGEATTAHSLQCFMQCCVLEAEEKGQEKPGKEEANIGCEEARTKKCKRGTKSPRCLMLSKKESPPVKPPRRPLDSGG